MQKGNCNSRMHRLERRRMRLKAASALQFAQYFIRISAREVNASFTSAAAAKRFALGDHALSSRLAGRTGVQAERLCGIARCSDLRTPPGRGKHPNLLRRTPKRAKSRRDRQMTNSAPGSTGATSSRHAARNIGKSASAPAGTKIGAGLLSLAQQNCRIRALRQNPRRPSLHRRAGALPGFSLLAQQGREIRVLRQIPGDRPRTGARRFSTSFFLLAQQDRGSNVLRPVFNNLVRAKAV